MTFPNSLTVDNLTVSYPNSKEPALQKVTLNVAASSILSIVGASGSGKSTLLKDFGEEEIFEWVHDKAIVSHFEISSHDADEDDEDEDWD